MDLMHVSPELRQKAIDQAEAEAADRAARCDDLARVTCSAPPLSYARRLIIGKVIGGDLDNETALMVCVFALYGPPVARQAELARKPKAYIDAAVEFADVTDADAYADMARTAAAKMQHLADAIGDPTPGSAGDGGGVPEGNAQPSRGG